MTRTIRRWRMRPPRGLFYCLNQPQPNNQNRTNQNRTNHVNAARNIKDTRNTPR